MQGLTAPQDGGKTTPLPKFDVVSINPVEPGKSACPSGAAAMPSPDALHITCMPLNWIIRIAYGIDADDRILGEPEWTKSAFYQIDAKVDSSDVATFGKFTLHEFGLMLQPVLEDRFHLRVHHETRDRAVYALVIARGGPKLDKSKLDAAGKALPPMLRMVGRGEIECRSCSLGAMPMFLSQVVGSTVVDQTGLTGNYDFTLRWTPDTAGAAASANDSAPSIFTAVQEQLGLRLEHKKVPADMLVIDHVEKPTAN